LKKKIFKKPIEIDEKRLGNIKTFEKYFEFEFRVFSLGFHLPAPPCPTPHPSPDKILKKSF
jgi:hypothetical protein